MMTEEICQTSSPGSVRENCQKNTPQNDHENVVSKFRIISSHGFALIAIVMFKFTYGLTGGFTVIIIPELYKADAEINVTLDELTWFSSYCFMQPVGALLGGFLTQLIGCRRLLIISGVSYATSGLIFYRSTNAAMLLCAQSIGGFVSGMQKGPTYTYLAEISLPQFRSFLMTCTGLCVTCGYLVSSVLGAYFNWRTVAVINLVYPVTGLVLLYFLPESPYWLASKNRFEEAKRSLAWFRGWAPPDSVEGEMRSALSNTEKSLPATDPHPSSLGRTDRFKESCKLYLDRSFYIPFLTIFFVFAVYGLGGSLAMNSFAVLIFQSVNSPVDPHTATILFSASRVLGSLFCMLLINLAGKRRLLFITLASSGIALCVAGVISHLTKADTLMSETYRWIPMILILAAVFAASVGIEKICLLLNSEIFPRHLRHVGVGVGQFINAVFYSLVNKAFLYLVGAIAMSGTLLFFGVASIAGLFGLYFIVPETEGKTLKEIEDHYAGKTKLRRNKSETSVS